MSGSTTAYAAISPQHFIDIRTIRASRALAARAWVRLNPGQEWAQAVHRGWTVEQVKVERLIPGRKIAP